MSPKKIADAVFLYLTIKAYNSNPIIPYNMLWDEKEIALFKEELLVTIEGGNPFEKEVKLE